MVFTSLAVCSLIAVAALGQFVNPRPFQDNQDFSQNPVWLIGTVENLLWLTTLPSYNLTLYQHNLQTGNNLLVGLFYQKLANLTELGQIGYPWNVTNYFGDLDISNVFFLRIRQGQDLDSELTSISFNLTTDAAAVTTTASSSSLPTTTSFSTSTLSTSATSTAAAPGATTVSADNSTVSTRIGLGVGMGLGIPLLIIAITLCFVWRRNSRRRNDPPEVHQYSLPAPKQSSAPQMQEMGGDDILELPAWSEDQRNKPASDAITPQRDTAAAQT